MSQIIHGLLPPCQEVWIQHFGSAPLRQKPDLFPEVPGLRAELEAGQAQAAAWLVLRDRMRHMMKPMSPPRRR